MPRPKNLRDMDHDQKVAWAMDLACEAIRNGGLRDALSTIISNVSVEAFQRGRELGRKETLDALPRRKAK